MNTKILKNIGIGLIAVLSLLGALAFFRGGEAPGQSFGATAFVSGQVQNTPFIFTNGYSAGSSQQLIVDSSGLLTIGASGSALTQVIDGTCGLGVQGANSINSTFTASTSASFDCAVTGVKKGDIVIASFPATTTIGLPSFLLTGAQASTTAGYISVSVFNASSTSFVPSARGFGSTTNYIIYR